MYVNSLFNSRHNMYIASFTGPCVCFTVGLELFLTRMTCKVEGSCVSEDSCSSLTTKEGSESRVLVATLRSPFIPCTD